MPSVGEGPLRGHLKTVIEVADGILDLDQIPMKEVVVEEADIISVAVNASNIFSQAMFLSATFVF